MIKSKISRVFISLGSNLGDRKKNLRIARQLLCQRVGSVVKESGIYETEPWGYHDQPDFYNQVVEMNIKHTPRSVLTILLLIEKEMGRQRSFKNAARNIDLDILFYDNLCIRKPGLIIPHPHIGHRKFILEPLCEIAPDFVHPLEQKTIKELLSLCNDPLEVTSLNFQTA